MNGRKLYKSRTNRMVCGVCGGVGEYFGVDPTVVRVIWALLIGCAGTGLLIYILAALLMSEVPDGFSAIETECYVKKLRKSPTDRKISGVCGGIAEYFGIDPLIIRIIWAAAVLLFGAGIFAYIICVFVIPD